MTRRSGFTLIELLVVVSIIALLVSILMPALGRAREQAKNTVCQMNLKQWGSMFFMYTEDNDGSFPSGWVSAYDGRQLWPCALRPYHEQGDITLCPKATQNLAQGGQGAFQAWGPFEGTPGFWDDHLKGDYGSYGINGWIYNPPATADYLGDTSPEVDWFYSDNYWRKLASDQAYYIPLFGDCWFFEAYPHTNDAAPDFDGQDVPGNSQHMRRFALNRHNYAVNLAFMDTSVRRVEIKDLWYLKWHRHYRAGDPPNAWPQWME